MSNRLARPCAPSTWFQQVTDGLFRLKEFLASKSHRPLTARLQVATLEDRVVPTILAAAKPITLADDTFYHDKIAGFYYRNIGDVVTSAAVDWGDGKGFQTAKWTEDVGPPLPSDGSYQASGTVYMDISIDPVGDHTFTVRVNTSDASDQIHVYEGQLLTPSGNTVYEDVGDAKIAVYLNAPATKAVSVNYATRDGTAKVKAPGGNSDYDAAGGTVIIPAGDTVGYATVHVKNDSYADEYAIESLSVDFFAPNDADLATPPGSSTATVTLYIADLDASVAKYDPAQFPAPSHTASTAEGNTFSPRVILTKAAEYDQSVFATDAGDIPAGITDLASRDLDYMMIGPSVGGQVLLFPAGARSASFDISICSDGIREPAEYFGLSLALYAAPGARAVSIDHTMAAVRILDWSSQGQASGAPNPTSTIAPADQFTVFDVGAGEIAWSVPLAVCGVGPTCGRQLTAQAGSVVDYAPLAINGGPDADAKRPTIQTLLYIGSADDPKPQYYTAILTLDGTISSERTFVPDSQPGDHVFLAMKPDTEVAGTGVYSWSMKVTAHYDLGGDPFDSERTSSGRTGVVAHDDGPLGPGIGLAGQEQVTFGSGNSWALMDYGDGTARVYDWDAGKARYTTPDNDGTLAISGGHAVYNDLSGNRKEYRSDGRLLTATDLRHNLTIAYNYDASGRLSTVVDPDGRVATFGYSGTGTRVQTITQVGGRVTSLGYNAQGRLSTISLPDAGSMSIGYDAVGRPIERGWGDQHTGFAYDAASGSVTAISLGGGTVTTLSAARALGFAVAGTPGTARVGFSRVATSTDALGRTTIWTLDGDEHTIAETSPDSGVSRWTYDAHGRVTTAKTVLGFTTTYAYWGDTQFTKSATYDDGTAEQFTYDAAKYYQPTAYTDRLGRTTSWTLDAHGDALTMTDGEGKTTTFAFDSAGTGLLNRVTDPEGNSTQYTYDSNRRLSQMIAPGGGTTTYTYDLAWNNTSITDGAGRTTTFKYDGMRRLMETVAPDGGKTTSTYYDPGWVKTSTDPRGVRTDYTYDSGGRGWVVTVTEAANKAAPRSSHVGYDLAGQVTSRTNGAGETTTLAYDLAGHVTLTTDPSGATSKAKYDLAGRPVLLTDALSHATTITYDDTAPYWGRRVTVTDPLGRSASSESDAEGQVTMTVSPNGLVTVTTYDKRGLTTGVSMYGADASTSATWTYDDAGRQIAATDALNNVTTYGYDADGNVTITTDALLRPTSSHYDTTGRLLWTVAVNGSKTAFGYDVAGRPATVTEAAGTALARSQTTEYDLAGNVTATLDVRGTRTATVYDDLGRVQTVTEAGGTSHARTTQFAYDAADRVTLMTDYLGAKTKYSYNIAGRTLTVTEAYQLTGLERSTTTQFDAAGQVWKVTDPTGTVTQSTYDAAGQLVRLTEAVNRPSLTRWTDYAYDVAGQVTLTTDPLGTQTRSKYDGLGRLLEVTEALGQPEERTRSWQYDSLGRPTWAVDVLGIATETLYDALGRVTRVTEAPLTAGQRQTFTEYAPNAVADRWVRITDALGTVSQVTFDDLGRAVQYDEAVSATVAGSVTAAYQRTWQYTYAADDQVVTAKNPRGYSTTYQYADPFGRLTKVTDALGNATTTAYDDTLRTVTVTGPQAIAGQVRRTVTAYDRLGRAVSVTDALNHTTSVAYDAFDRAVSVTDPLGNWTSTSYDDLGRAVAVTGSDRPTTQYGYDANDQQTSVTDGRNNTGTVSYDRLGRVTAQTDPLRHGSTFTYDPADRVLTATDAAGRTTMTAYDDTLRTVTVTGPTGSVTQTASDLLGRVTLTLDGLDHATQYGYDPLGRLVTRVQAAGATTTLGYDKQDNLVSLTDPVGNTTTYDYDALDRVQVEADARGKKAEYFYDPAGRLTERADRADRRKRYIYDADDRLVEVQWRAYAGGPVVQTFAYGYDAAGHETLAANAAGAYTLDYNGAGQTTDVAYAAAAWQGAASLTVNLAFKYDGSGNRVGITDSFGGRVDSLYDAANAIVARTVDSPQGEARVAWTRTARGQAETLTRWDDLSGTTVAGMTSATYTADGLVESLQHTLGGGGGGSLASVTYGYDAARRVVEQVRDGLSTAYNYDDVDELVQEADGASITYDANGNRLSDGAGTYTYGAGNQLLTAPSAAFEYDADGNVIVERNTLEWYGYDLDDRLAWVAFGSVESPTLRVDYLYDAWGNQVGRAVTEHGVTVERHLVDGWKVAQDFWGAMPQRAGNEAFDVWADVADNGTLLARRAFGDGVDEPLVALGSALPGGRVWYFQDRLGSVVAEVDGNGNAHTATYTAWGGLGAGSELVDRYGWTGREHDWVVGLINLRDRYYDPTTGRFWQEDMSGFTAGDTNLYRYAGNSPTNATDPSGRFLHILGGIGIGAVVGAAVGGLYGGLTGKGGWDSNRAWAGAWNGGLVGAGVGAIASGVPLPVGGFLIGAGVVGARQGGLLTPGQDIDWSRMGKGNLLGGLAGGGLALNPAMAIGGGLLFAGVDTAFQGGRVAEGGEFSEEEVEDAFLMGMGLPLYGRAWATWGPETQAAVLAWMAWMGLHQGKTDFERGHPVTGCVEGGGARCCP